MLGLPMAKENREEEAKLSDELASNVVRFSMFLDPHLRAKTQRDRAARPERWSWRRAAFFILAVSLILWGIIIALIQHVYQWMALRGRQ